MKKYTRMLFGMTSVPFAQGQAVADDSVRFVDRLNRGEDSWIWRAAVNLSTVSLLAFVLIMLAAIDELQLHRQSI